MAFHAMLAVADQNLLHAVVKRLRVERMKDFIVNQQAVIQKVVAVHRFV